MTVCRGVARAAAGAQRSSCTAPSHRLLTQSRAAPLVASGFERKRKTRFAYAARAQHLAATAALVEKTFHGGIFSADELGRHTATSLADDFGKKNGSSEEPFPSKQLSFCLRCFRYSVLVGKAAVDLNRTDHL